MGPTDALSWRDHLDTTGDNADTPILPDPMVINSLDLMLARHIKSSSASDPFMLKALTTLDDGSPLFTHTSLLAAGAVLMQSDEAGDLHPCAYFSKTFSLAEHNYDIYD